MFWVGLAKSQNNSERENAKGENWMFSFVFISNVGRDFGPISPIVLKIHIYFSNVEILTSFRPLQFQGCSSGFIFVWHVSA